MAYPVTTGDLISAADWNTLARPPAEDTNYSDGSVSQASTSTTYTATWNAVTLPAVTVTTGTAAMVFVSAFWVKNSTAGANVAIAFSVSGATTVAADDQYGVLQESETADALHGISASRRPTLTAGSNTFQMEGRVSAGTGTIARPRILVIPLEQ